MLHSYFLNFISPSFSFCKNGRLFFLYHRYICSLGLSKILLRSLSVLPGCQNQIQNSIF